MEDLSNCTFIAGDGNVAGPFLIRLRSDLSIQSVHPDVEFLRGEAEGVNNNAHPRFDRIRICSDKFDHETPNWLLQQRQHRQPPGTKFQAPQ